jgi:hypothetical protein
MSQKADPREFTTSFPMRCGCCDEPYPAGTLAKYAPGGRLVAVDCENTGDEPLFLLPFKESDDEMIGDPSDEERREARARMCPKCFMVKPASGVCGTCF